MRKILEELQKKSQAKKKTSLDTAAKGQLAKAKKEYLATRKDKLKQIQTKQKSELATVKNRIAGLAKRERVAAGKKLRAAIREKYAKIRKGMPTAARKQIGEVASLLKNIKSLRI
jgi:hypothetical protein